jgi:DNA polymerase-3 subunit epsilon
VAQHFGIRFGHHDALEDARAAGEIVLLAIEASGVGIEGWLTKSFEKIRH